MRIINVPPIFRERLHALCLLSALVLALTLPVVLSALEVLEIQKAGFVKFRGPASENENFPFYRKHIYQEEGPIDVLFIGPCTAWWQIETEPFEHALEKSWKRPVHILNFGYNHASEDLTFLLARETLRMRRVRYLALPTPRPADPLDFPHPNAYQWWLSPRDVQGLRGLPIVDHLKLYAVSVMGAVRLVPLLLSKSTSSDAPPDFQKPGGTKIRHLQSPLPPGQENFHLAFFESEKPESVQVAGPPIPQTQRVFLKALVEMAHEAGTQVIWVSSPLRSDFEGESTHLREREHWTQLFPGTRFLGLRPDQVKSVFGPQWPQLFVGENLTPAGAQWFSENWAEAFSRLPDR